MVSVGVIARPNCYLASASCGVPSLRYVRHRWSWASVRARSFVFKLAAAPRIDNVDRYRQNSSPLSSGHAVITTTTSPPGFNLITYRRKPTAAPISSWSHLSPADHRAPLAISVKPVNHGDGVGRCGENVSPFTFVLLKKIIRSNIKIF